MLPLTPPRDHNKNANKACWSFSYTRFWKIVGEGISCSGICFPVDVVEEDKGRFIGWISIRTLSELVSKRVRLPWSWDGASMMGPSPSPTNWRTGGTGTDEFTFFFPLWTHPNNVVVHWMLSFIFLTFLLCWWVSWLRLGSGATTNLFFQSLVVECRRLPDFRGFPTEPAVSLVIPVRKQSSPGLFLLPVVGYAPNETVLWNCVTLRMRDRVLMGNSTRLQVREFSNPIFFHSRIWLLYHRLFGQAFQGCKYIHPYLLRVDILVYRLS